MLRALRATRSHTVGYIRGGDQEDGVIEPGGAAGGAASACAAGSVGGALAAAAPRAGSAAIPTPYTENPTLRHYLLLLLLPKMECRGYGLGCRVSGVGIGF